MSVASSASEDRQELIERCAKAVGFAIFERRNGRTLMPWMASPERDEAIAYVRETIKALRDPTDAMIRAFNDYAACEGYPEKGWAAAIDEALK